MSGLAFSVSPSHGGALATFEDAYDAPIPGGGSQYVYRRVDRRDAADKREVPHVLCLGHGSFASTLDCVRILGGVRTPVAIKQIALDKRAAEAAGSGEQRGLSALAGRAHPCIVRYLACFQADEGGGRVRLSFVFERCPVAAPFLLTAVHNAKGQVVPGDDAAQGEREGADLMNNPIARAPLALAEAVYVVKQLLSAIAYLHAANIVHRDIKPENTLVWGVSRGAGGERLLHVKITDYGTMRTAMAGEGLTVGSGTRNFMAPEVDAATGVAAGRERKEVASYDGGADVFSVGATFFFLVTGESPSGNTKKAWEARLGGETTVGPERTREWYKAHAPDMWARAKAAAAAEGGGSKGGGAAAAAGSTTGLQFSVAEAPPEAMPEAAHLGASTAPAPPPPPQKPTSRLPLVSTLNYFFPPGTPQRELLEGLVGPPAPRAGGGGGGERGQEGGKQRFRFSAAQALAWFAESPWRDLKTPGDSA